MDATIQHMSTPQGSGSQSSFAVEKMLASHTAALVEYLPKDLYAPGLPKAVQYAAIEGFFANVRSLIEFLGVEGIKSRSNSVTAHKIKSSWNPVNDPKLKSHYIAASTHAVHFTADRMSWVIVDQAALEKVANDVLTVWNQFAAKADDPLIERRGQFTRYPTN